MCEKIWFFLLTWKKDEGCMDCSYHASQKYMWWEDNSNFSLIGLIKISLARIILL
jgi:hypothetical protein